jgi:hypothetical protein
MRNDDSGAKFDKNLLQSHEIETPGGLEAREGDSGQVKRLYVRTFNRRADGNPMLEA